VEPPSGADPDRRPYGGRVTAVCDGEVPGGPAGPALARGLQGGPAHRVRKARFERASREV